MGSLLYSDGLLLTQPENSCLSVIRSATVEENFGRGIPLVREDVFRPGMKAHAPVLSRSRYPCFGVVILVGMKRVAFEDVCFIHGNDGNGVGSDTGQEGLVGLRLWMQSLCTCSISSVCL